MNTYELLSNIIIGLAFLMTLIGVAPYRYNKKSGGVFERSSLSVLYSIVVVILFSTIYPPMYVSTIQKLNLSVKSVRDVAAPYVVLNVSAAIIIYIANILHRHRSIRIMNMAKSLLIRLATDILSERMCLIIFLNCAFKMIVIPVVAEYVLVESLIGISDIEKKTEIVSIIILIIPYLIRSFAPNAAFGTVLVSTELIRAINNQIQKIIDQIRFVMENREMSEQKVYYKTKLYCELSEQLDSLFLEYSRVREVTQGLVDLTSTSRLFALLCNSYMLIIQIYLDFVLIMNRIMNGDQLNVYRLFCGLTYSLALFLDIFIEVNAIAINITEVKRTGKILHQVFFTAIDPRLKATIEAASLDILLHDYSMSIFGLFKIDRKLLHRAINFGVNAIVILIQFDLSNRK